MELLVGLATILGLILCTIPVWAVWNEDKDEN